VAACTGPISWIGYQNCENTFVSPGAMKEKSGWLSVKTPAISSTYAAPSSLRLRSHACPNSALPQVHCFLPIAMCGSATCTNPARAAWSYPPKNPSRLPTHM
jgi:hypothetical protein